jgi:hypothetical protein
MGWLASRLALRRARRHARAMADMAEHWRRGFAGGYGTESANAAFADLQRRGIEFSPTPWVLIDWPAAD